jgi:hypothetical protein
MGIQRGDAVGASAQVRQVVVGTGGSRFEGFGISDNLAFV